MLQTLSLNLTNATLVPDLAATTIITTSLTNTTSANYVATNAAIPTTAIAALTATLTPVAMPPVTNSYNLQIYDLPSGR